MDVYEAVTSRRAVRGFTDRHVPREVLERVLSAAAWSVYRKTVAEIVSPPDGLILFCGMSIGFEDVTVGYARARRAPLDETVTFVEDQVAGKVKVKGPSFADHITDSHAHMRLQYYV